MYTQKMTMEERLLEAERNNSFGTNATMHPCNIIPNNLTPNDQ